MICYWGLGWNQSGGLRERVTPSQMPLGYWCQFGLPAQLAGVVQPSESIMGLFKGACESKSLYYVIMLWDYFMGLFRNPSQHAPYIPWGKSYESSSTISSSRASMSFWRAGFSSIILARNICLVSCINRKSAMSSPAMRCSSVAVFSKTSDTITL